MRGSEIRLRKLKLRLSDKRFANHKVPCTAIWQQPLQSVLALRSCGATDLFYFFTVCSFNNAVCWKVLICFKLHISSDPPGIFAVMYLAIVRPPPQRNSTDIQDEPELLLQKNMVDKGC